MSASTFNSPTFTEANMETVMCLWEAMQDLIHAKDETALRFIEQGGTADARSWVIMLTKECEAAWEAAREAGTELIPYDWGHCPDFLARQLEAYPLKPST